LNEARTGLVLEEPLDDNVVDDDSENEDITFGEGFSSISDLEVALMVISMLFQLALEEYIE
jgi:hypothetical protein